MRYLIACLFILTIVSCDKEVKTKKLKVGTYRAVLEVLDNGVLPFIFEVVSPTELKIVNAEEIIDTD